jgi:hypothetical protein
LLGTVPCDRIAYSTGKEVEMISSYSLRMLGTVILLLSISLLSATALQEEPEFGPFGAFPSPPETELTGVSIDIMKLAVPSRFIWDTGFSSPSETETRGIVWG